MKRCIFIILFLFVFVGCARDDRRLIHMYNANEETTRYVIQSVADKHQVEIDTSEEDDFASSKDQKKDLTSEELLSTPKQNSDPPCFITTPTYTVQCDSIHLVNDISEYVKYDTTPKSNITIDRIFLLSIEEVLEYFGDSSMVASGSANGEEVRTRNQPRIRSINGVHYWGIGDEYNCNRIARQFVEYGFFALEGRVSWWLRSHGRTYNRVAFVAWDGMLNLEGQFVLPPRHHVHPGVRPALWLCLQFKPSEATEPQTTDQSIHISVGDIIPFGNYYWIVLEVQYTQALIITDHVIMERNFHERRESVTWETSDIRKYLNSVFLETFSQSEQERIIETEVINNDNPWTWMAPVYVEAAIPGANTAVGDIVRFGSYNWRVLAVEGSKALIITENIVGVRHFHTEREHVTWETSEIRRYLNKTFYYTFPETERSRIMETTLHNPDNPWDFSDSRGHTATPGGNTTTDRIFLLSIDEVLRYFGDSGLVAIGASMSANERIADLRPGIGLSLSDNYNSARTARDNDGIVHNWWLRSPGSRPTKAAFVSSIGFLHICGMYVLMSWDAYYGVRPALWLSLVQ